MRVDPSLGRVAIDTTSVPPRVLLSASADVATALAAVNLFFAASKSKKEPIRVTDPATMDPVTGWIINNALELEAAAIGIEWLAEITPLVGTTIESVSVVYTPPSGHGVLPDDQPIIALYAIEEGVPPVGAYEELQDNALTVLAYETKRTLTLTLGTPLPVESDKRYWISFRTETGGTAATGTQLHVPAQWVVQ